jgi:hypothetical protein
MRELEAFFRSVPLLRGVHFCEVYQLTKIARMARFEGGQGEA